MTRQSVQLSRTAMRSGFLTVLPKLLVEPGRYSVADAGVLRTEVSCRSPEDEERWVYLYCGKFDGLAETRTKPSAIGCEHRTTALR
jgi:ornithine decarboxylase